jgi:hypothetical protein
MGKGFFAAGWAGDAWDEERNLQGCASSSAIC